MIYFDNAATTWPKPRSVARAVAEAIRRYGANPGRSGHHMSLETATKVYETREAAASMFGVDTPENVVFTLNCSHALNLAIKGFTRPGDHIIISDLEHNSVLRPIHALAERGLATYSVVKIHPGDDEHTLAEFRRVIRPETSLIACTHGSNAWGICTPIAKISTLAAQHGIFFLVDAAQTAGVVPINIKETGIDFLCVAGHKSLYGPPGTGMMITSRGDVLQTIMEGGTGSYSANYSQPTDMPDCFECGTVNTLGIIGLGAGIAHIADAGIENIYSHEMQIGRKIYERLQNMPNVELYTDFTQDWHLPVLSFNIRGKHSEQTTGELSDMGFALRGGLHCSPLAHEKMDTLERGAVRISIGMFNTEAHVLRLCTAINSLQKV